MPKSEEPTTLAPSSRRRQAALDLLADGMGGDGLVQIPISGQCMEPLIVDGDRVSAVPCRVPELGDIVLARTQDQELVCHRILGRTGDDYVLAGDRTLRLDVHPPESLIGRVVAVHREKKTLSIPPSGMLERCQAYLHLKTHAHRGQGLALLFHWPRRLLIVAQSWRWYLA